MARNYKYISKRYHGARVILLDHPLLYTINAIVYEWLEVVYKVAVSSRFGGGFTVMSLVLLKQLIDLDFLLVILS